MKNSEILINARQLLVIKGWCQGHSYSLETGAYCSAGAIRKAVTGDAYETCGEVWDAREILEALVPSPHRLQLINFNDARGRTEQEILELFDAAISLAMSEEAME